MSSSQEIENGVKDIVIEVLSLQKDRIGITRKTRLVEDLGADSLDVMSILMSCEDKFGVVFQEEVSWSLRTIGDIVSCIERGGKGE